MVDLWRELAASPSVFRSLIQVPPKLPPTLLLRGPSPSPCVHPRLSDSFANIQIKGGGFIRWPKMFPIECRADETQIRVLKRIQQGWVGCIDTKRALLPSSLRGDPQHCKTPVPWLQIVTQLLPDADHNWMLLERGTTKSHSRWKMEWERVPFPGSLGMGCQWEMRGLRF